MLNNSKNSLLLFLLNTWGVINKHTMNRMINKEQFIKKVYDGDDEQILQLSERFYYDSYRMHEKFVKDVVEKFRNTPGIVVDQQMINFISNVGGLIAMEELNEISNSNTPIQPVQTFDHVENNKQANTGK